MKKIFSFLLITCLTFGGLSAQGYVKQYYTLGWQMTQPVGDFSDFANQYSLRGGYFDGKFFLKENISIGFNLSYDGFNEEKDRSTYSVGPGTVVTASVYNYVVEVPITFGGFYHFRKTTDMIQPYAGLGIGLNYITEHTIVQDWDIYDDQWAFIVKPEVGMYVPFGATSPFGFNVKVAYEINTNSLSTSQRDYDYLQAFNIGLGITCLIR